MEQTTLFDRPQDRPLASRMRPRDLDEFAGQLPFQLLLNVLDRYPCKLPCRFHDTWAGWTTVWIISNKPLEKQYQDVEPEVRAALDRRISDYREFHEESDEEWFAEEPFWASLSGEELDEAIVELDEVL